MVFRLAVIKKSPCGLIFFLGDYFFGFAFSDGLATDFLPAGFFSGMAAPPSVSDRNFPLSGRGRGNDWAADRWPNILTLNVKKLYSPRQFFFLCRQRRHRKIFFGCRRQSLCRSGRRANWYLPWGEFGVIGNGNPATALNKINQNPSCLIYYQPLPGFSFRTACRRHLNEKTGTVLSIRRTG